MTDPIHAEQVLTQEQQAAIGCVAVESARLENLIMLMIWSVLGLEVSMGRLVTDNISTVSGKLALLHELINNEYSTVDKDEFNVIFQKIKKVIPRRNTVIHGLWEKMYKLWNMISQNGPSGHARAKSRSRKSNNVKMEDADKVMEIAREIHSCYSALQDYSHRQKVLPPLQETFA